jgi:hypothetical protein
MTTGPSRELPYVRRVPGATHALVAGSQSEPETDQRRQVGGLLLVILAQSEDVWKVEVEEDSEALAAALELFQPAYD